MFEINTDAVKNSGTQFLYYSEDLRIWKAQVADVRSTIGSLSGMEEIVSSLEQIESDMNKESDNVSALSEAARNLSNRYDKTEDIIVDSINSINPYGFSGSIASIADFSGNSTGHKAKIDYITLRELMALIS